jgi:DNA-binding beta-propeller fold protein YncE
VVSAAPNVTKIKLDTFTLAGSLALSGGGTQYDIAIDPSEMFAYVTNQNGGTITKIDLSTFKVAATLTLETPYSVAIDSSGTFAYVTNHAPGTLTKIDLSIFNLVGSPLACGEGCAGVAIAGNGNIYVVNTLDGTVTEIDYVTFKVVRSALAVGTLPQRIAIDSIPSPDLSHKALPTLKAV